MKSFFSTPRSRSHFPAGLTSAMSPAGEMWSVVTESPSITRQRAPEMSRTGAGSAVRPPKKGGSWMYVLCSSQAYRSPPATGIAFHRGFPSNTFA